ncbi:MAG TPA: hypothetical protein VIM16_23640 [Mucilaginibacter sp.]
MRISITSRRCGDLPGKAIFGIVTNGPAPFPIANGSGKTWFTKVYTFLGLHQYNHLLYSLLCVYSNLQGLQI